MVDRPRVRGVTRFLTVCLPVVVAVLLPNCNSVPLTAPTESTITIFANANTVSLNAGTDITALVTEKGGTPVQNGTLVTFATTLGTLDPPEAQTRDGRATVRFSAGNVSGTARISAFSGSASTGDAPLELKVGGAAASRVQLTAEPGQVPSTGGTVQLVAVVTDEDGNRLSGIPVTFTASAGQLGAATASTNSSGTAQTSLNTDRETSVRATAGNVQSDAVTVRINQAPAITISLTTTDPQSGQPIAFNVSVTAGANSSAVRDVVVDFGDGQRESLGRVTGSQTVTHVYATDGSYRVTATVTDTSNEVNSVSTVIVVTPVQISVSLSTSPTFPRVDSPVTITVQVSPTNVRIVRYDFDFGDGTFASQGSNTVSHIYRTTGVKTITVTAVTSDGQAITSRADISVTI